MASSFRVVKEKKDQVWMVFLSGTLDEDAKLHADLQGLSGSVRMNLKDVSAINSCGIREWVTAMRELGKTCQLVFEDVSVPMIQQFNMVLNARGSGRVVSFYAPYFCPSCDREEKVRLDLAADAVHLGKPGAMDPPDKNCGSCRGALEFDDIPEKYFLFLETQLNA